MTNKIEENQVRKRAGEIIKRNPQGKLRNIEVKVVREGEIKIGQGHQKERIETGGTGLEANQKGTGHVGEAILEDLKGGRIDPDRRVLVKIELGVEIKVKVEKNLATEVGVNVDREDRNREVLVRI